MKTEVLNEFQKRYIFLRIKFYYICNNNILKTNYSKENKNG